MSAPSGPMKPALLVMIDERGNPSWEANLPLPWLNLLLDRIKLDILTGKVKQQPQVSVPTLEELAALKRNGGIITPS